MKEQEQLIHDLEGIYELLQQHVEAHYDLKVLHQKKTLFLSCQGDVASWKFFGQKSLPLQESMSLQENMLSQENIPSHDMAHYSFKNNSIEGTLSSSTIVPFAKEQNRIPSHTFITDFKDRDSSSLALHSRHSSSSSSSLSLMSSSSPSCTAISDQKKSDQFLDQEIAPVHEKETFSSSSSSCAATSLSTFEKTSSTKAEATDISPSNNIPDDRSDLSLYEQKQLEKILPRPFLPSIQEELHILTRLRKIEEIQHNHKTLSNKILFDEEVLRSCKSVQTSSLPPTRWQIISLFHPHSSHYILFTSFIEAVKEAIQTKLQVHVDPIRSFQVIKGNYIQELSLADSVITIFIGEAHVETSLIKALNKCAHFSQKSLTGFYPCIYLGRSFHSDFLYLPFDVHSLENIQMKHALWKLLKVLAKKLPL